MAKKNEETVENNVVEETVTPEPEVKVEPQDTEKPSETKEEVKVDEKIKVLADSAERGVYGTGRERMTALGEDYFKVEAEVNRRARL